MKRTNYFHKYKKLYKKYLGQFKSEYLGKISKAREPYKINAHNVYRNEFLQKQSSELQTKLGQWGRLMVDAEDKWRFDNTKEFPAFFNEEFENVENDRRDEILELTARFSAIREMYGFKSPELFTKRSKADLDDSANVLSPVIKWKGTNETEFVQLVYALFEAGYISNTNDQITKLVPQVAKALNFDLGNNWQVNLSTSLNKRNADYSPKIFENLRQAFEDFRLRKLDKNKKNKAK
ncbi:MAG: RteC domain-containing protein [Chitinophagales bacterium]